MDLNDAVLGTEIYREICSQPHAWGELIPAILAQSSEIRAFFKGVSHIVLGGCGSGLNAARYGAPLLQMKCEVMAQFAPAIDLTIFPETVLRQREDAVVILLSRSGRTTEVLQALDAVHGKGIPVFAITCSGGSPLAEGADYTLVLDSVQEKAVTTTRSLTGMLIALQLIAALISDDQAYLAYLRRLPELCGSLLGQAEAIGREIGSRTDLIKYAFIANGPNVGVAHEAQLKIKETTCLPADAYPMLDFRHGPQATVSSDMLIVACTSRRGQDQEENLIHDMQDKGAVTCVICDQASNELRAHADYLLEFRTGGDDLSVGPLYLPPIQFLACYRSLSLGLNPDQPQNLAYWIDTSE